MVTNPPFLFQKCRIDIETKAVVILNTDFYLVLFAQNYSFLNHEL